MRAKGILLILTVSFIMPLILSSCGGGGGGGAASGTPEVSVVTDTGTGSDSAGISSEGDTGDSGDSETANLVLLISTNDDGKLPVNYEYLDPADYSSSVTVVDENGNTCEVTITDDGSIKVKPADGSIDGTYTVTITENDREYELVITVTDGVASVVSASSSPAGYSVVLNLNEGKVVSGDLTFTVTSEGLFTGYSVDSSVENIVITDKNGNAVSVNVDPVTGDLIVPGDGSGPYTIVITTEDGSVIKITTDNNGKIGSVTINSSTLILDLNDGYVTCSGTTLNLTTESATGEWALAEGVQILSVTAKDTITIDTSYVWINKTSGDIMILGTVTPEGPYTIKVLVDGETYIIQTDASGTVTGIIPGNTLLTLTNGYVTNNSYNVVQFATGSNGSWAVSGSISNISATDSDGRSVSVSVNTSDGNLVTSNTVTDPVTIVFDYTDSKGNIITYTLVVANGTLISYQALITDPGEDFDFSTVTNVKISLYVVNKTTGLAIGQASINLVNSNGTYKWEGFTNSSGISIFEATVETANSTAKVIVTHDGYEKVECEITGIGKLIEFGKKIAMTPVEDVPVVTDSDNDGVPDTDDEFPNDDTAAKTITGVYTLAYEDLYPNQGDADFNDLVVRLTIVETIDGQNRLRKIDLKTKLLAAGAGYTNKFAINIYGTQYILISNPKADTVYTLGSSYNSNKNESYRDCEEFSHDSIVFDGGIDRTLIAPMPYDPYIICNGDTAKQAHLPSVKTTFTGNVIDSTGFPWALIVPDDWAWPYEGSSTKGAWNYQIIKKAYPYFDDWYISDGESCTDWYNTSVSDYIYQK